MTRNLLAILFLSLGFSLFSVGQTASDSVIDGMYIQEFNRINGRFELRNPDPVQVKLINATGYDIDAALFYSIYFPLIKQGDSTSFFCVPNYEESDFVQGKINGMEIDNALWVWHCKGVPYNYENKSLLIEIVLAESQMIDGAYRLETKINKILD